MSCMTHYYGLYNSLLWVVKHMLTNGQSDWFESMNLYACGAERVSFLIILHYLCNRITEDYAKN